jgi:hypothetical protein
MPTIHSTFAQASEIYGPEDLEAVRQAFMRACDENPLIATTEAQRHSLAKALLSLYGQASHKRS